MWSIIRARQNLSPNADPCNQVSKESKYEIHQHRIFAHECKPCVPWIEPKIFTLPYSNLVFDKIRRWLLDEDAFVRVQAADRLIALYVNKRENCVESLSYEILPLLVSTMCSDEDAVVRARAVTALELLVQESQAQYSLLEMEKAGDQPLERILSALNDEDDAVVVLTLRVITACHAHHNTFAITEVFIGLGSIPAILHVMERDDVTVKTAACSALVPIFDVKEAFLILLQQGGLARLTQILSSSPHVSDAMLIAEAAEVITRASEYEGGKREGTQQRTLQALMPYLDFDDLSARVAVTAAMAQLTQHKSGKELAIEIDLPESLVACLSREDERDVLMFMSKLIYNVANHPKARPRLRPCLARLGELLEWANDDEAIAASIVTAMRELERR